MKYAFLLYPHQNIRYRQSLEVIAAAELSMTLAALGVDSVYHENFFIKSI